MAKLVTEVHKKYLKSRVRKAVAKLFTEALPQNKYMRWCSRFLPGFIVASTPFALRSSPSLSSFPLSPLRLLFPSPCARCAPSARSNYPPRALRTLGSRLRRAPPRSYFFFVVFSFVLFFLRIALKTESTNS